MDLVDALGGSDKTSSLTYTGVCGVCLNFKTGGRGVILYPPPPSRPPKSLLWGYQLNCLLIWIFGYF